MIGVFCLITSVVSVIETSGFFLCVTVCIGMKHTKFHCNWTKTFCRRGVLRELLLVSLSVHRKQLPVVPGLVNNFCPQSSRVVFNIFSESCVCQEEDCTIFYR